MVYVSSQRGLSMPSYCFLTHGVLAQVCVRHSKLDQSTVKYFPTSSSHPYLRILGQFDKIFIDIFNFHGIASCRIRHGLVCPCVAGRLVPMGSRIPQFLTRLRFSCFVKLSVSVLLVLIKTREEFGDRRYLILACSFVIPIHLMDSTRRV